MKKIHPIFLSIAAGIILWLSWPTSAFTAFIFLGFVPLLWLSEVKLTRPKFFGHCYLAMLTWNTGTTWWIWNSTDIGTVAAIAANSFLMCFPWLGYRFFKNKFGRKAGYFSLISFWMLFEFIHLNWQLSWPWLSLGNVFAMQPDWVQWYEYTGIGGGTLWVLLVNVVVYNWMMGGEIKIRKSKLKSAIGIIALLVIPVVISYLMSVDAIFNLYRPEQDEPNVIIVQPNIDPYGKFDQSSVAQQLQTLLQLTGSKLDSNTRLVIWPETALSANVAINDVETNPVYKPVFNFINAHPNVTLLSGIETMKWYSTEKPESPYARKTSEGYYYDSYNAAVSIKAGEPLQFYIKSKLVPGVETLPAFLNFLGPVFEKFGGTTGGYAMDTASVAFKHNGNPFVTAPIICYESIYGEYVTSYVNKGANLLTIMTNDGWWGNTPGHKQHLNYARLRAIETRRWVARSANTGISAVINDYGEILETQPWNKAAAIRFAIPASITTTFYTTHGDYLYRIFSVLAGLLVLWVVINVVRYRLAKRS